MAPCPACGSEAVSHLDGRCLSCGAPSGPVVGADAAFEMRVDRVEALDGMGLIAHGRVAAGTVRVGDAVVAGRHETMVVGVTVGGKLLDRAGPGDLAGVVLRRLVAGDVAPGQLLVAAPPR